MTEQESWSRKAAELATNAAFWIVAIAVFISAVSTEAIDSGFIAILAIGAMSFVATFVHEVGHAVVAHRRGAQINMIAVLPFAYAPPTRKFSIVRERRGGDIAGFVNYHFPEDSGKRRDEIAIAAAGPVWNLICALLLALAVTMTSSTASSASPVANRTVVVASEDPPVKASPSEGRLPSQAEIDEFMERVERHQRQQWLAEWFTSLIQVLIAVSVASGVLNLLPYRDSDGAVILEHWRWLRGKA